MRVLIVDDEQPARDRMRQLLAGHGDVEIVGEAEDGTQAIERILELGPDVVFLDIQMPGCSGLDVAASLPEPAPAVIFCTAYDQHAVDAFELRAVDYLLKPVNRTRLEAALSRVRGPSPPAGGRGAASREPVARPGQPAAPAQYPSRFLAKRGTRFHVVPRAEVLYFSTEDGLTRLQAKGQHYWMQPSLTELEARLDPAGFFRVSRAAIVCLDAIVEVIPAEGGQGHARLADGTMLPVSRRRLTALLEHLDQATGANPSS
jgi:two-component system, LytTR family, response regulator